MRYTLVDPSSRILSGWWFGTFFIFPYIGNNHPNWLIFFRGVQTTNQLFLLIPFCVRLCSAWYASGPKYARSQTAKSRVGAMFSVSCVASLAKVLGWFYRLPPLLWGFYPPKWQNYGTSHEIIRILHALYQMNPSKSISLIDLMGAW